MAVKKVDMYVSEVINDLNNGFTWLKKDDLGYGSIEEKYGANPVQIATIRKHPSLKNAETNIVIFNVVDDVDVVEEPIIVEKAETVKTETVEPTKEDVFAFNNL